MHAHVLSGLTNWESIMQWMTFSCSDAKVIITHANELTLKVC